MRAPSIWLLGLSSGLSVFGMAIIVPSMQSIATAFDAEFSTAQFAVSAYLFGLAVAQPVSGVLADRFGRRPVMLTGFALFTLASLLCALAPSLSLLIGARFLQAISVSVGTVTTRAILRDMHDGERMAEAMSYIAAAMGLAPVVAPIAGGLLDANFGYRAIFLVTAGMGAVVFVAMARHLQETLPPGQKPRGARELLGNYGVLVRSPQFVGYTLIYGFMQGAFFSFLAIGASFFLSQFGIDAGSFGMIWGLLALAYVLGATAGARLTPRVGARNVMRASVMLLFLSGIAMLGAAQLEALSPVAVLAPLGAMMMIAGSGTPGAMSGAVQHHPTMAGTASGFSSAIALVVGGSFTIVSGALYDGTLQPIATLIFVACSATAASWLLARRP